MSEAKYDSGYVMLSRELLDSSLWNLPPEHLRIAIYLLLKARHSKRTHNLPDGTTVGRGELVTSMLNIAENCSFYENRTTRELSRKKVLNILLDLENIGFINRNSHRKGTHISICNYDTYQDSGNYKSHSIETERKQSGNTEGTQRDTNNNVNNGNNENNEKKESPPKSPKGELSLFQARFLQEFNEATGKKMRVLDKKTRGQLKARITEGYTLEEIITATINCKNDPFHVENPRFLTPEFITRADKLQKYLQKIISVEEQQIEEGYAF